MINKGISLIIAIFFVATLSLDSLAQLSAPGAGFADVVSYPSDPSVNTDTLYVFCSLKDETKGVLKVNEVTGATYSWEKYNPGVGYEAYVGVNSEISGLSDGGYRCTVVDGTVSTVYRAWITNFWSEVAAEITESNCEFFKLSGSEEHALVAYYDVLDGNPIDAIEKTVSVIYNWDVPWDKVYHNDVLQIYNPEASDSPIDINLEVKYDSYGCSATTVVTYNSIVPKAEFSYDPKDGEAPLVVDFSNQSENADSYEWYIYKKEADLRDLMADPNAALIDSLLDVYDQGLQNPAVDENFELTYYRPGDYRVKLVVENLEQGCKDSLAMEGLEVIKVDTSWVTVPNVFTPNGDGMNDNWQIQTTSVKSLEVNIFNRWGRLVHSWSDGRIESSEEITRNAVWDGTVNGNNAANTGVYFYVIEARGWDDKKLNKKGSIHLFTDQE